MLQKQRVWSRLLPALLPSARYDEFRSTLQCCKSSGSGHGCSPPSSHPPGMLSSAPHFSAAQAAGLVMAAPCPPPIRQVCSAPIHTSVMHKQLVWSRLLPALLPSARYVQLRSTLQCCTSSWSGHGCSLPSSPPPGMFSSAPHFSAAQAAGLLTAASRPRPLRQVWGCESKLSFAQEAFFAWINLTY